MKKRINSILEKNKKTYNIISQNFSGTRNRPWPEFNNFVDKYIKEGQDIIDIGCGNGRVFDLLKNKNIKYIGTDYSEGLINEAKNKFQKFDSADFVIENILDLQYKNKFDIAFCIAVLNHLPTTELQQKALDNIYKSLKPSGYLLLTNWNMWNTKNKKSWWRLKLLKPAQWLKSNFFNVITYWGKQKEPLYYYAFNTKKLNLLLKKSGFRIIESYHSLENKKVKWWEGKNIVHIIKK